ncbi:hypothetical protein KIN20_035266 [Parelaphostrongylus tenuis]|uniref:Uncharacterized protein n=1 Tax=Parelaphostrongylus tenuis TaxID=148309 RepID=A0AAD5WKN7_PARTN|nr:hypothetical protein KIN20_035266 [Parelaphostrongylus tenuis]
MDGLNRTKPYRLMRSVIIDDTMNVIMTDGATVTEDLVTDDVNVTDGYCNDGARLGGGAHLSVMLSPE